MATRSEGSTRLFQQLKRGGINPAERPVTISAPEESPVLTKRERDEVLTETSRREEDLPLLIMAKSSISLFSWEEMKKLGQIKVTNPSFSGLGSVNDPRMGVVSLSSPCVQCGQIDCPGHYGLIDFGGAIYN